MNVEDLMKENLRVSGKKLEIISDRHLGVALDDFVLKQHSQAINDNVKEKLRSQHKRRIKRKRGEDEDEQEGGTTLCQIRQKIPESDLDYSGEFH